MRTHYILQLLVIGLIAAGWPALAAAQSKPEAAAAMPAAGPQAEPAEPRRGQTETCQAGSEARGQRPNRKAGRKARGTRGREALCQGRDALFQGKYDEAIGLLSKAVAADKTKTSYRLHLARAYRYAGKDDQAAAVLEEILKTAPDHIEAGQALGETLFGGQAVEGRGPRASNRFSSTATTIPPTTCWPRPSTTWASRRRRGKRTRRPSSSTRKARRTITNSATSTWRAISSLWPPIPTSRPSAWGWIARCCGTSSARPSSTCGTTSAASRSRPSSRGRRPRSTAPGT